MNKLQRFIIKSIGLEQLTTQQQAAEQPFNRALYQFVGGGLPISNMNASEIIKNSYELNAIVYSIVDLLCQCSVNVEYLIYRRGKTPQIIETHDFYDVMQNPSVGYDRQSWLYEAMAFRLLTGNNFNQLGSPETGANTGKVIDIRNLPAHLMVIESGGWQQPVTGYTIGFAQSVSLRPDQVHHVKMFNPDWTNGQNLYGMAPLKAAIRLLAQSNEGANAMVASFKNGGARGYLYEDSPAGSTLTEEQFNILSEIMRRSWFGSDNTNKTVFGSAKLAHIPMGLSPVDLNILEAQRMTVRDLCNIYHVPAELMNDPEHRTYANEKEAGRALYSRAIMPHTQAICSIYNRALSTWGDKSLYVAPDASKIPELQKDILTLVQGLASAWWLTANERREMMDFSPVTTDPRADQLLVPAGLVSAELSDAQLIQLTAGEYGGVV